MATSCGFESHRPHQAGPDAQANHMLSRTEITTSPALTFDALVAGKAGAPLVLLELLRWIKEHTTIRFEVLGLVSHALGQGLITLSLGSYGAGAASLVMVWPALVSVLAAWALFGEQPTPVQAFGGVAILAAVLLVRRG